MSALHAVQLDTPPTDGVIGTGSGFFSSYDRWLASLCGGVMIRISLPYVYNLAVALEKIPEIQHGEKKSDRWLDTSMAHWSLDELFNRSVFASSLRSSRQSASTLITLLKAHSEEKDHTKTFQPYEVSVLNHTFSQFKTIFLAEIETLNAHFATQKRGYDTVALIDYAEIIFPPDLPSKAPESVPDIRAAGRCIAFELPTAAAFHLHRAHESILHLYYDAVTGGKPRPSTRNIGDYLNALQKHGVGGPKLLSALKDLKDMHRNPLIHPDQSLDTVDEAIALMGSIHNTVVHMLKAIPAPTVGPLPPTPTASGGPLP